MNEKIATRWQESLASILEISLNKKVSSRWFEGFWNSCWIGYQEVKCMLDWLQNLDPWLQIILVIWVGIQFERGSEEWMGKFLPSLFEDVRIYHHARSHSFQDFSTFLSHFSSWFNQSSMKGTCFLPFEYVGKDIFPIREDFEKLCAT